MNGLHPDLSDHEEDGLIHHPLIIVTVFEDVVAEINDRYLQKKAQSEAALAAGAWEKFVWLHERPYRVDALVTAVGCDLQQSNKFWPLVGAVWQDSENIFQHLDAWKQIWLAPVHGRTACMSGAEQSVHSALPETSRVWRGIVHKESAQGLSWTLQRDKAEWFARRFSSEGNPPLLVSAVVSKVDVLAYFDGRGEFEVVSHRVSVNSIEQL